MPQLRLPRIDDDRLASQPGDTSSKGEPGTGGGFIEDHRGCLRPLQCLDRIGVCLEVISQVEDLQQLLIGEVQVGEEVTSAHEWSFDAVEVACEAVRSVIALVSRLRKSSASSAVRFSGGASRRVFSPVALMISP